jgi:3-oxoacyl-[acyl-carrier-protein] synthase III
MIISSIAAGFPSLRITNADLLQQVLAENRDLPPEQVQSYCNRIEKRLNHAGAAVRFYRDRDRKEAAYPILMTAITEALVKANLRAQDIDLLIYCGVGRGFLEPAMAYFVASGMSLSCDCFDIVDACMSWVRALHVVYNFFATGRYSNALVVNAEFNVYESGYPALTKIGSDSKPQSTFPAFTIGEAATATVLTPSKANWNFRFRSIPKYVGLCTLPLRSYAAYSPDREKHLAANGVGNFACFGDELSRQARKEMLQFIAEVYPDPHGFNRWFPHVATAGPYSNTAKALGLSDVFYTKTFARYGNLVSASIPVAMLTASLEGDLHRGDRVVLCPISAGISIALVDFIY